jgi:ferredoxin-NADP reductase
MRALLETMPAHKGDLTLLYRVSRPEDLIFRDELERLALARGIGVHYLVGPRDQVPDPLGPGRIGSLVRDVARRDVYLCGPAGMVIATRGSLRALGVPDGRIHTEEFEL